MRFRRIEIDGFGALSGISLDGLTQRLNVIYGPNGAGKTTLLQFLRGMFCGYADARRLGLLPVTKGGPGGGAIEVDSHGSVSRFGRSAGDQEDGDLRTTLLSLSRTLTKSSSASIPSAPVTQIPLLFLAGQSEVAAVDKLIRRAQQDGIELAAEGQTSATALRAARELRARLANEAEEVQARITSLNKRRQQLELQLQRLRDEIAEQERTANEVHSRRQAESSRRLQQRVDWLHAELQAAQCDLREAEDRAWARVSRNRLTPRRNAPVLRLRRLPATRHLHVARQAEVESIDRRVAEARIQLADIARARFDVDLRAARIAGCPALPTSEFVTTLRQSLGAMEDALLEFQTEAERLDAAPSRRQCVCSKWSSAAREGMTEMRRRLYGTCDTVSRFELVQLKAELDAEAARLDREAQAIRLELESLDAERRKLFAETGRLTTWRGEAQSAVDRECCQCSAHHDQDIPCVSPPAAEVQHAGSDSSAAESLQMPSRETAESIQRIEERLSQLGHRRQEIATALLEARRAVRRAHREAEPLQIPDDVRRRHQQAAVLQQELDAVLKDLATLQQRQRLIVSLEAASAAEAAAPDLRPACIRWASEYLLRLTAGRYCELRVTLDPQELSIIDDNGSEFAWRAVSRGLLAQIALSLRLALLRAYAERGIRFPLVLDDVLVDCDLDRLQEAVELLKAFADEHDQQILYLTCGTHTAHLFRSAGVSVQALPGATSAPMLFSQSHVSPSEWFVQGWVERKSRTRSEESFPVATAQIRSAAADRDSAASQLQLQAGDSTVVDSSVNGAASEEDRASQLLVSAQPQPDGPFWLSMDSSLQHVPSIGAQMGRRMSALGIETVCDLLALPADESSIPLRSLQVDVRRLRDWQAEALLLTCVPNLTARDAELLVSVGIEDPHQLAECDVAQLIDRLDRHARRQRDPQAVANLTSREDLQRWIHSARRSRSVEAAMRDSRLARGVRREFPRAQEDRSEDRAVVGRVAPAAAHVAGGPAPGLRFHLSPSCPVVDAPSIGPKMASRLASLGVVTVGDLLACQPVQVAERLKSRRVKAETIAAWQQQARLVCRIPELRGHDAQVLVACDITEPEQVARMDARTLFGIVGPFVQTTEGQRLLRSSNTPDLQEVTAWIDRAQHARPLRAA
ncbi:MAG: DUF4332 domain-containing protein [Planctomycetaceae bacterium]|nr:DUF4332 domain-containing protein [Planctomycetaceae bacterium]